MASERRKAAVLRRKLWAAIEAELGAEAICTRCNANLSNFDEACAAALDEACEGFRRIDEVWSRHYARINGRG